jgi:hypothetical protein
VERDERQGTPPLEYVDNCKERAKVIDAFIVHKSMAKLASTVPPKRVRPPSYHPGEILKIYLYGYLNRKRLTRAVVDLCTGTRDDVALVSSACTGARLQSMSFGLGKKAHRFAATFHGSNSSTRLIG